MHAPAVVAVAEEAGGSSAPEAGPQTAQGQTAVVAESGRPGRAQLLAKKSRRVEDIGFEKTE